MDSENQTAQLVTDPDVGSGDLLGDWGREASGELKSVACGWNTRDETFREQKLATGVADERRNRAERAKRHVASRRPTEAAAARRGGTCLCPTWGWGHRSAS